MISYLASSIDRRLNTEFVQVSDVCRIKLSTNFEHVVISNAHTTFYWISLSISSLLVEYFDILFNDAVISKDNVPTSCMYLGLWVNYAASSKNNFAIRS